MPSLTLRVAMAALCAAHAGGVNCPGIAGISHRSRPSMPKCWLGCHCWLAQQCGQHCWASQQWHPHKWSGQSTTRWWGIRVRIGHLPATGCLPGTRFACDRCKQLPCAVARAFLGAAMAVSGGRRRWRKSFSRGMLPSGACVVDGSVQACLTAHGGGHPRPRRFGCYARGGLCLSAVEHQEFRGTPRVPLPLGDFRGC